jgi:hypothetical protein
MLCLAGIIFSILYSLFHCIPHLIHCYPRGRYTERLATVHADRMPRRSHRSTVGYVDPNGEGRVGQ